MNAIDKNRAIIPKIVKKIADEYKPEKIILFGSYAYGEPTKDSDVDLLIVKNTDKDSLSRWMDVKRLLRDVAPLLPVSPLVYTEKEVEARNEIKDFFVREVFSKGKILYG